MQAGGNVILNANTKDGREGAGNIRATGSDVSAGQNLGLIAENDILLTASDNTNSLRRDSESYSWGAGVGIAIGKGVSVGFTANGSLGRGEAEGDDVWRTNSHLTAGDTLFIQSGGDTTFSGATAKGKSIIADVGKNLTIESLQDTSTYKSDDWNASGSVTVGYGFSGSASYSQNKVDADFRSVTEQSGLFAGDGGFNVYVGEHTDLTGAVIASSDNAARDGKNQFSTGTIETRDIKNRSSYDASGFSIGGGYSYGGGGMIPLGGGDDGGSGATTSSGGVGKDQQGNATTGANADPSTTQPKTEGGFSATTPIYMSASDDTSSKTRAGISGGDITIRDEAGQKARTGQTAAEAIAGLNRDVSSDRDGTNGVDNLYERDKDKIDAGFEITRAFQNEVGTFVVNKAKEADAMKKELEKQGIDPETNADYLEALKWAPGGAYSQVITAITAATGGNVMGGFDGLAQAAVLNYVQGMGATEIKKLADSIGRGTPEAEAARAVLQGLAACGAQAGQGGDCASAGLGTAAGVIANAILNDRSKAVEDMTSEEKKAREDLITSLVAGIAGASGGDAGSAAAGMQVEQENNALGKAISTGCSLIPSCKSKIAGQLLEIGVKAGISGVVAKEIAENISDDDLEHLIILQMMGNDELTGKYLSSLQDKYVPSHTGNDQLPEALPSHTGNNADTLDVGPNHTGNDNGKIDAGPNHTGGNHTAEQLPSNTGNTEGVPDLPTHYENSNKITQGEHAKIRNSEGRPVGSVINDVQKSRPADILVQDDGRWVIKGNGGKVHVIEPDGEVVTSFYNPKANTDIRVRRGEWNHPSNEQLEQFKQKFSDYIKW